MAKERYMMRQNLIAIGDDFYIENRRGKKIFKVDGKALRIRETLHFEDLHGNLLCKIQEKMLAIKDTMAIEGPDGKTLAKVKKALISPLRDRWTVSVKNGDDLDVKGDILDHTYKIRSGRKVIAEVSKKWFRLTDTYGVEIEDGQNHILILAIVVALDMMVHDEDDKDKE